MKNYILLTFLFVSLVGYSQKKSNFRLGITGGVYRSDLYVVSALTGDGKTKYFPTWNPLPALGIGITASKLSHKFWNNSLTIESQTFGFNYELGNAKFRYLNLKIASGIKYKKLMFNFGSGIGKSYDRCFMEGAGRENTSTIRRNNFNKTTIFPVDFEIGFSESSYDIAFHLQSIFGELFPKMTPYDDRRFYNYPYNFGLKVNYWIKQ